MSAPRRLAMVAMPTSPIASPGAADAGGMNVAVLATAIELAQHEVEVELLTRATGQPRSMRVADGVTLHEIAAGPRGPLPQERMAEASDEFGEGVAAHARAGEGYDLIHAHHWRSGIATLPVAIELGLPFVQSFHTLGVMKNGSLAPGQEAEPEDRLRSEAYLAGQADAVVGSSVAEVGVLLDQVGAPAGKVWVVPPGVDSELFSPARAVNEDTVRGHLGITPDRPIVLTVGRVHPGKGQDLAIQAVAAIAGERPVLVVAGEPPSGSEHYAELLHEASGNDVVFTGALAREELADLYAAAALTIAPGYSETFGLVPLESAASGTPVLASAAVGRAGAVVDGVSGIVVPSRDPADWAQAIASLLGNALLLDELSTSGRAFALDYSWAASARGLLDIYASLT